jgi:hypothetical protein
MPEPDFPVTVILKEGTLRVISLLPPALPHPLLKGIIDELAIPSQNRHHSQEEAEEADGTPSAFYHTLRGIDADALCLLSRDGAFVFILLAPGEKSEATRYQQRMREQLLEYIRSAFP